MNPRMLLSSLLAVLLVAPGALADEPPTTAELLRDRLQAAIAHHQVAISEFQSRLDALEHERAVAATIAEAARAEGGNAATARAEARVKRLDDDVAAARAALDMHIAKKPAIRPLLEERRGAPLVRIYDVKVLMDAGLDVEQALREQAPDLAAVAIDGRYAAVAASNTQHHRLRALLEPSWRTRSPELENLARVGIYDIRDLAAGWSAEPLIARLRRLAPQATIELGPDGNVVVVKADPFDHARLQVAIAELRSGSTEEKHAAYDEAKQAVARAEALRIAGLESTVVDLRDSIAQWQAVMDDASQQQKRRDEARTKIAEQTRRLGDLVTLLDAAREAFHIAHRELANWPTEDEWERAARGETFVEWEDLARVAGRRNTAWDALREQLDALREARRLLITAGEDEDAKRLARKIADLEAERARMDESTEHDEAGGGVLGAVSALRGDVRALRSEVRELTGLVRELLDRRR